MRRPLGRLTTMSGPCRPSTESKLLCSVKSQCKDITTSSSSLSKIISPHIPLARVSPLRGYTQAPDSFLSCYFHFAVGLELLWKRRRFARLGVEASAELVEQGLRGPGFRFRFGNCGPGARAGDEPCGSGANHDPDRKNQKIAHVGSFVPFRFLLRARDKSERSRTICTQNPESARSGWREFRR